MGREEKREMKCQGRERTNSSILLLGDYVLIQKGCLKMCN
jgi:hypothetical protein